MLILGRRPGDAVIIDGHIKVVVVSVDRGMVRLGIEAPREVTVLRAEIATQIADENRRAGSADAARGWLGQLGVKKSGGEGGAEASGATAAPPAPEDGQPAG